MKLSLFIIFFIFSLNVFAGRNPELEKLFKNDFRKHYVQNQCGSNILEFLRRSETKGLNL